MIKFVAIFKFYGGNHMVLIFVIEHLWFCERKYTILHCWIVETVGGSTWGSGVWDGHFYASSSLTVEDLKFFNIAGWVPFHGWASGQREYNERVKWTVWRVMAMSIVLAENLIEEIAHLRWTVRLHHVSFTHLNSTLYIRIFGGVYMCIYVYILDKTRYMREKVKFTVVWT